jgi:acyl carrier protein
VIDPRLEELVRAVFAAPDAAVTEQTTPADIPNWDSLGLVNLIFAIEERFNVQLDTEELIEVANFGELQQLISARAEAR